MGELLQSWKAHFSARCSPTSAESLSSPSHPNLLKNVAYVYFSFFLIAHSSDHYSLPSAFLPQLKPVSQATDDFPSASLMDISPSALATLMITPAFSKLPWLLWFYTALLLFLTLVPSVIHLEKDLFDFFYFVLENCRDLGVRKTGMMSVLMEQERQGKQANKQSVPWFMVIVVYKAAPDIEIPNIKPLLLGKIQGHVPESPWSHFHQMINT